MKPLNARHAASGKKRKEIIRAALHCFVEKGYSETRIADICRRCNANTGSIYHHFTSKEGLAAQVYLEGIKDYQEGFARLLKEQTGAKDGIYALVAYHLEWVVQHPAWARFLIQKRHAEFMGTAAGRFKELNRAFMAACAEWFRRHIRTGELRPLPGELYVAILLGPCQEYAKFMVSGTIAGTDTAKAAKDLGDAAWQSLRRHPT